MTDIVIGIDVGTTSVKVVAVDTDWRVRARASQEYSTRFLAGNGAEQDPQDWWDAARECLLSIVPRLSSRIRAVGVSGQAPSLVPLDAHGEALGPAILWMDRRGQAHCRLDDTAAATVTRLTGNRPDSYYAAPKLAWLRRAHPPWLERVRHVVMANGYLVHRLTGQLSIDTGHAGLSLLNELDSMTWSDELCRLWGVPRDWLPPMFSPSQIVAEVSVGAAAQCGLPAGTPVVAGLVDGAAASLEAGVVTQGDVCEMTGQSTVLNAAVRHDRARAHHGRLSVMPYPIPGHHLVFGSMVSTGGVLRWFRDQFDDPADPATFARLDELAATAELGSGGLVLLPYFLGERSPIWDSDARGALIGLSMDTTRAAMVRAILEGTAYALAHNLEELAGIGVVPRALRVVGGGALGNTWNSIKADVTATPLELPAHTAGAPVGAALVAAQGVGIITDLAETARSRVNVARRFTPVEERHQAYRPFYQVFRQLYPALRDANDALAVLR